VPAMTFVATAEAVVHVGAVPRLVDVDPDTLLIDPAAVAAVRSDRLRAVIPVHLYGHVVDPAAMSQWRSDGLVVIEDAAQAHLAQRDGDPVGTHGSAACFSFYPGKNLGAFGDGGLVMSDDDALLDRARLLRDHGRTSKYTHDEIGWCSRLDGLQAAILLVKLRHLDAWTRSRQALATCYRDALADIPEVRVVPWHDGAVHHLLCVRVPASRRADVKKQLERRGIETGIHFPLALSTQPALRGWAEPCPAAELAAEELLSLPMDPLMTHSEVAAVCDALRRAVSAD
jgi:dTDP-4-amino-4,6-dideoxygalactose transaminase